MTYKNAGELLVAYWKSAPKVLPIDVAHIAASVFGMDVYQVSFKSEFNDSVFGFIRKAPEKETVEIGVNRNNSMARKRFTIAHELGHYCLHHRDGDEISYADLRSTISSPKEAEANRFASELLMPENLVKEEHNKLLFPTVGALADRFAVSRQAMKIRLIKLGLSAIDI